MTTKLHIKTPFFGNNYFSIDDLQPLIPFPIISLQSGNYEMYITLDGDISQEIVNNVAAGIKVYILENIITVSIV